MKKPLPHHTGLRGQNGVFSVCGTCLRLAKHFATRRLKKTGTQSGFANCFQNADGTHARDVRRVFRNIEAHAYVALRSKMINFVRLQAHKEASPDSRNRSGLRNAETAARR